MILKSMDKPSKLNDYDRKGDQKDHMMHVDDQMSYLNANNVTKCMLLALTLVEPSQLWFNVLPDRYDNSWKEFRRRFYVQFIALKR